MVKVLVATTEGQGERPDDYAEAVDGELVYVPLPGPTAAGTERGFAGMASGRLTTTALVVDRRDLGLVTLSRALADSLERQHQTGPPIDDDLFRQLWLRLLVSSSYFAVGSILERSGERLHRRARTEPLPIPEAS